MHFTYGSILTETSGAADNPKDVVRFLIGDTAVDDPQNQLLSDEEILSCIDLIENPTPSKDELHGPAADAAEAVATKFRKFPPTRVGGLSNTDPRYIVEQYEELSEILRSHLSGDPMVYAGGLDRKKYPRAFIQDIWEDTRY
jgi:hypothetical protein